MATFYDCFVYSSEASAKYFLPENVHGVWVIGLPGWGVTGALGLARTKSVEDGCLIAIQVYGVLVLVGPISDPELLLRDVLELQQCADAVVGPRSAPQPDAELASLVEKYSEAKLFLAKLQDSGEELAEAEWLIRDLESQIRVCLADFNEGLGNPSVPLL